MASDEDNFDIDIYGDGEIDMGNDGNMDYKQEDEETSFAVDAEHVNLAEETAETKPDPEQKPTPAHASPSQVKTEETQPNGGTTVDKPTPAPTQGVKRKETSDERPIDHGATNALMISDLHWWITEDDIRGWANKAGAEDELREITFSEHKVNGKSKGTSQAYLEFSSPQAATATKHEIESQGGTQASSRKHSVVFTNATQNPFKTLPKDAPVRTRDDRPARGGTFNSGPRADTSYGGSQGYRGGRGGGFNRGYGGHGQYNRNFSGPMGGYNNNNNNHMGFQGTMGMNNNYAGFNRGGMMGGLPTRANMGGMRGGRGGINNMMPMGGMGMGNMGMNPMMAGMGMPAFQANQFNPGMFNAGQGQGFGGGDWNQHGAKRQRQD
ncbi:hypothetical protein LTR11_010506 [Exophiala xenobiotica]|nr:hypothetical protein LTR11_010506 [Exophiala xenobiotica]